MFRLTCDIQIGSFIFKGVTEVEIQSSWDTITDVATITFPRKLSFKNKNIGSGTDPLIKKGDLVDIKLGYDDKNTSLFKGYVRSVSADTPIQIECEDEAFTLKKGEITKTYRDVTLKQLLKDVMSIQIGAQPDNVGLGPFRISKATAANVLDHLKNEYYLMSWFRDRKLYIGLAYWPETSKKHKITFERSVISHTLKYRNEDDIKIKLTVINITPENKKIEYQYGDDDGDVRTIHVYNRKKSDIDTFALQQIQKMKYTGFQGSFVTFGQPAINHGDVIVLNSTEYPERNGEYLVKSVNTRFGSAGFRQEVELDIKI